MSLRLRLLLAASALVVLPACATTIEDESGTTPAPADVTTTIAALTVPQGTARELLPLLVESMTGLSALIGPDVGPAATDGSDRDDKEQRLVEIEAIWAAARDEVESADELVARQVDGLVAMARTAVERNRPADADKAARFIRDVVASYLGDSG